MVHPEFKSHTIEIIYIVQVVMQSVSRKQKLNTSSSTEAGLVAADYASVYILYMVLSAEWKWYKIYKNILYQDENIAIMLEVNVRRIAGKKIQTLNIR